MRFIPKQPEPEAFRNWKRSMAASPQNLSYDNLPGEVKDQVKTCLLNEQGHLCAYTMQRLAKVGDCHIEHIQSQGTSPELDLEYANMAACFPKDGGDVSHGYGAPIKGGNAITLNVNFVSPHSQGCAERFNFNYKGQISAAPTDVAAEQTIAMLKLDHDVLIDLRRRAIETHGLAFRRGTRTTRKLKSAAEARRFAVEVLQPGPDGRLEPFCIALSQVALDYAAKEEARSQRLRSQHGGSH